MKGTESASERSRLVQWSDAVEKARASFTAIAPTTPVSDFETIQNKMSRKLVLNPIALEDVNSVLGIDVQYEANGATAAAVMLDRVSLSFLRTWQLSGEAGQSYEHGFLAFRELPVVLELLAKVDQIPDVIFYDGNGILHPRGFGAASHLGVLLNIPTVGISKNVSVYRPFSKGQRGDVRVIENGSGALLVTRDQTNPVCVSPGHKVDLDSALQLVLVMSKTRIPEPIRLADQLARQCARGS